MKHLLCEHQNTISELKAGSLVSADVCQKEYDELKAELFKTMAATMSDNGYLDFENRDRTELELKMVSMLQHVFISCGQKR